MRRSPSEGAPAAASLEATALVLRPLPLISRVFRNEAAPAAIAGAGAMMGGWAAGAIAWTATIILEIIERQSGEEGAAWGAKGCHKAVRAVNAVL